ncbi:beta-lactoglobulin isoform 3-T3 [Molossus nigricans]
MKRGHRLPGLPSPWAPGIMALETGPLLLLALSLGLASAQKTLEGVPVQPGFDAHKVEGRWLTIRLAASQARLVSPTDPLRLALHSIETRDRDLELVLFWRGENVCRRVSVTIHPTGQPGQYQGSSRRMPGDPKWLGQYLEYVREFRLQEAPVFNLDAQCPPPEA